jgi:hypothetical protein
MDSSWLIYDMFFSPLPGNFFPRITDVLSDSRVSWVTFGLAAFLWVEVVTQGILLLLCRDLLAPVRNSLPGYLTSRRWFRQLPTPVESHFDPFRQTIRRSCLRSGDDSGNVFPRESGKRSAVPTPTRFFWAFFTVFPGFTVVSIRA